jgi:hypothetical protein
MTGSLAGKAGRGRRCCAARHIVFARVAAVVGVLWRAAGGEPREGGCIGRLSTHPRTLCRRPKNLRFWHVSVAASADKPSPSYTTSFWRHGAGGRFAGSASLRGARERKSEGRGDHGVGDAGHGLLVAGQGRVREVKAAIAPAVAVGLARLEPPHVDPPVPRGPHHLPDTPHPAVLRVAAA